MGKDLGRVSEGRVKVIKIHCTEFPKNQSNREEGKESKDYLKVKSNSIHLAGIFFYTKVF